MSLSKFIANRYIYSKKKMGFFSVFSIITISGIALGVFVLILSLTVLDGYDKIISDKIYSFNSHLKISAFGNNDLPNNSEIEDTIKKTIGNDFVSMKRFVEKGVIIKKNNKLLPLLFHGLDLSGNKSYISKYIINGNFLNSNKKNEIIIGKALAKRLNIKVGDEIILYSVNSKNISPFSINSMVDKFKVSGIFKSGMAAYDDQIIYTSLITAQNFFQLNNKISGYNIRISDISKLKFYKTKLTKILNYPYYPRTMFDIHRQIFTWIKLQKKPIPIVLGLIILVAIFNIISTLLIMILQRLKDIGIFKTLGMNKKSIRKIFVFEGLALAIIGIIIGDVLALALSFIQIKFEIIKIPAKIYFISDAPIYINWVNYFLVSMFALIFSYLAALIPARIAANYLPIKSLRFK